MPASSLGDRRHVVVAVPAREEASAATAVPQGRPWIGVVVCTMCVLAGVTVGVWAALR